MLEQGQRRALLEQRPQGPVLPPERQAEQPVPLAEVHGRRRPPRLDPHDRRVDLGRGAKVVGPYLEQVVDAAQQLDVRGQAAVQRVPGAGDQPHRELVLEHDDRRAERRGVRQQLEGQRRRDLVGDVCHTQIEIRQLRPHHVALQDRQLGLVRGPGDAAAELEDHARVDLDGDDGPRALEQPQRQVPRARPYLEDDVGGFHPGLVDDGVDDGRVLEDVLPPGLEELDAFFVGKRREEGGARASG